MKLVDLIPEKEITEKPAVNIHMDIAVFCRNHNARNQEVIKKACMIRCDDVRVLFS